MPLATAVLGLAFAQLDDKPSAVAAFKAYVKLAPTAKDVALIQQRDPRVCLTPVALI